MRGKLNRILMVHVIFSELTCEMWFDMVHIEVLE